MAWMSELRMGWRGSSRRTKFWPPSRLRQQPPSSTPNHTSWPSSGLTQMVSRRGRFTPWQNSGNSGGRRCPALAGVDRLEQRRARRCAGAGVDHRRVAGVHGDGPHRHAGDGTGGAAPVRTAVVADAETAIGAGVHPLRARRVDGQRAHHAVELDRLLQAQAVPGGAVVVAAQDALAGGGHHDGEVHARVRPVHRKMPRVRPPSQPSDSPVIEPDRGDARKAMIQPISSGCSTRRIGVTFT